MNNKRKTKIAQMMKLSNNTLSVIGEFYRVEMENPGDWEDLMVMADAMMEERDYKIPIGWVVRNSYKKPILTNIKIRESTKDPPR